MAIDLETIASSESEQGSLLLRSLEARALKGTYHIVLWFGLAMGLRLLSSIVLTHLFAPAYFGIMALMTTVIVGMTLFSHIGLEDSVIQNPRGDEPVFLNTAWTLQAIRGAGLWLLTFLIAWPVARFYHEPQIIALLPAVGVTCLIAGVSSPSLLVLSRHMGVGRLSALEVFSQLVQFVVTIVWARIQPTIWALVAGRIASEITRTIISYWLLPEIRARFTWDKESIQALVSFGRWILVGTALTFLALQSDRLILAKLVSFQLLGVYGVAFALSDIPRQVILQFCARVGFPFLSRFSGRPRQQFRSLLLKYRLPVLSAGGLLIVGVVLTGDVFIHHVYTKPYQGAAWMIGILAIGLWHTLLYSTVSPAVFALQKSHYNAFAYLTYCITLYAALPLSFHFWGMPGAVIAIAASDLPVYFVTAYGAYRERVSTFRQDGLLTLAFLGCLALALACRAALGFGLPFAGMF